MATWKTLTGAVDGQKIMVNLDLVMHVERYADHSSATAVPPPSVLKAPVAQRPGLSL